MGWDQKDAVGESLREGDRVKVFRDFGEDKDCADVVGMVGFSNGYDVWVHHMSVMKV